MRAQTASDDEETIKYSERVNGDRLNWNRAASFDITDGYIGINSFDAEGVEARVLLTPKQFRALKKFVEDHQ